MDATLKEKLQAAMEICNEEDRSTEYMLEFMQDFADTDLDTVLEFLEEIAEEENGK